MKKHYFVVSDPHGFTSVLKDSLEQSGFKINNRNHFLIICGDLLDRGNEPAEMIDFLLSIPKNRLILIRGNHEDLFDNCLSQLKSGKAIYQGLSLHHINNGTLTTIAQLMGKDIYELAFNDNIDWTKDYEYLSKFKELESRMVDYYELGNYIFVHGWIPVSTKGIKYTFNKNWRKTSKAKWNEARWLNGMDMANNGLTEPHGIIVCGHWHCSYGNKEYLHKCKDEFGVDADFSTYYNDGIIALDACTALTNKINVLHLIDTGGYKGINAIVVDQKTIEDNKELVKKYPWLKVRNVFTGKSSPNYDYSYTYYDWIPEGWRKAFGMQLIEELDKALGSYRNKYRIYDIKEKFGSLRWYDNGLPAEAEAVIRKYEKFSELTCIDCGKPAQFTTKGWIEPYCEDCLKRDFNVKKLTKKFLKEHTY